MGRIFISLVVGIVAIGSLLVYQATLGTSSLMMIPSEIIAKGDGVTLNRIRVGGRVAEPILYTTEPSFELQFNVEDPKNPNGSVPVVYRNVKPDMFAAGRDVLIDGDYRSGRIEAAKLLTQCPSKYEPPSPEGSMKKNESSDSKNEGTK